MGRSRSCLSIVALLLVGAGAFVGGDVVYVLGNMVSRHAFRGAGTKWIKLDLGELSDLADLPDATPTKARAGINDLVLVRTGDTVHAMHAVCAHAGGPLPAGRRRGRLPRLSLARRPVPPHRRTRHGRSIGLRPADLRDPHGRGRRLRGPTVDDVSDPRDPVIVRIPDPSLVALVGAAGSGKSTFAARHFAPDEILSSDAFRAAISGDAADQSASPAAFKALHAALDRRLRDGRLTVVDATNLTARARRALVSRAAAAAVPAIAIVLDLPDAIVLARNAARLDRVVPEDVVRRHLAEVRRIVANGELAADGFVSVVRLTDPDQVDRVVVSRDPGPVAALSPSRRSGRRAWPAAPPRPRCSRRRRPG